MEGPRGAQAIFGTIPGRYKKYRPSYPTNLIDFLSEMAPNTSLAWDCGTGSGQAAQVIAQKFDRVIATDMSTSQIAHAEPSKKIQYRVASAGRSGIPNGCVDLTTAAHAVHWFNLNSFYREVARVSKPNAIIACWCYGLLSIDRQLNPLIRELYYDILQSRYWPKKQRDLIDGRYEQLYFPFVEIPAQQFDMFASWTRRDLLGYLRTWSAVRKFKKLKGTDPISLIRGRLRKVWPDPRKKRAIYLHSRSHAHKKVTLLLGTKRRARMSRVTSLASPRRTACRR